MEAQSFVGEEDSTPPSPEDSAYTNFMLLLIDNTLARLPEKSGWLLKRTRNPFKPWQRRFFTLRNKKLRYYHKDSDSKPAGSFNFDLISLNLQLIRSDSKTELILQPLFAEKRFRLRGESEDLEAWAVAISEHISASAGRFTNVTSVSRASKFWKWDRISNSQFKATASTGDILLFSGKNLAAKAQRFVTRSKYDHVALILKYSTNQLALLEATSMDVRVTQGVQVLPWSEFLRYKWHLLYTRLVYRPLDCERTDEMLRTLEEFIREVRGKRFKLSAAKLIGRHREQRGTEEGYFCSELIASAFKRVGLLGEEEVASKVWPGGFSTEKKLQLRDGASLGEELLIDFDPEDSLA